MLDEPESDLFTDLLLHSTETIISAAIIVEIEVVALRRFTGRLDKRIEQAVATIDPRIVAVTAAQAQIARTAFRRFGRGTGHRANLNFGDCFSYALAKETGRPLLFKGDDFPHTDIEAAA